MIKKLSVLVCRLAVAASLSGFLTFSPALAAGGLTLSDAEVNYTCRLSDGRLAATTLKEIADKQETGGSPVFIKDADYGPVKITISEERSAARRWEEVGFRSEIRTRLEAFVKAMREGETRQVLLESSVQNGMPEAERFIKIARVQKRPKSMQLPVDSFRRKTSQDPEVGSKYDFQDGLSAVVSAFDGKVVDLQILSPAGGKLKSSYGDASIRDAGEYFELDIDARPGTLLRAGPLVGRISRVDENWMTIDFGHPFGGETLICDVTVESVQRHAESPITSAGDHKKATVQAGDAARVSYSIRSDRGSSPSVDRKTEGSDPGKKGTASTTELVLHGSERMIAGEASVVPGLSAGVIGMSPGEKKRVRLPVEKAFGTVDDSGMVSLQAEKRLPRVLAMDPSEFMKRFQVEPQLEAEVPLTPYFKGRVVAFEGQNAIIAAEASESSVPEEFGTVAIRIVGDEIVIKMKANVGADFEMNGRRGRIVKADDQEFTVDFNHPLAGQDLLLEIEVVSLIKAQQLKESALPWQEDYEQGVEAAVGRKKPMVLLLHAEWCDWCKKLMAVSLQDDRIKLFQDDFVWVRVDSDKQPELAEAFQQKSFPLIVILNPKGEVVKKIDGYRDAAALKRELEGVL